MALHNRIDAGVRPAPLPTAQGAMPNQPAARAAMLDGSDAVLLTSLLENAREGIQQVDAGQVTCWANPAVLAVLGYEADEYIGRRFRTFFVDDQAFDQCWRTLLDGHELADHPVDLRAKDDSVRRIRLRTHTIREGGRLRYCHFYLQDVTAQVRMEEALWNRNQELRKAVAVRDEFLSVAAHELKTPATTLRAYAQLLQRDLRRQREVPQERLEAALGAIESQSKKLDHLVGRLLDTAQIEEGRLRIDPQPVDLAALVGGVVASLFAPSQHTLVTDLPDRLDVTIDPIRFEQVITNLLNNAVKYSPEGGTVTVSLQQHEGGTVQLAVTDEGIGIRPADHEAIFSRFYQGNGPRHLSGLGLGLYITREIVSLHGGDIGIEDPGHRGSRFVVTLPPAVARSGNGMRDT